MLKTVIPVTRTSVVSSRPFDDVVTRLTLEIGHPDPAAFHTSIIAAKTVADLEMIVQKAIGPSELIEFIRFDSGAMLRKEPGGERRKMIRLVIGNPVIMKEMARTAPDAASYAPVTVLIDERTDGVHLSYDSMASLIAPYESEEALKVAKYLDSKVENLLVAAAE